VVTTSGTLVTLIFAVAQFVPGAEYLPGFLKQADGCSQSLWPLS